MERINEIDEVSVPKKEKEVVILRHFDEVDDLEKFGRDAVLSEGQEHKAETIAARLLDEMKDHNMKGVLFVTSQKNRAKQTAQMVIHELLKKDHTLKCFSVQEYDLRAIDQGEFILPTDYVKGQLFEGLSIADKIFLNETHASDYGEKDDNYDYKYGDPVLLENGKFKYPELTQFFVQPGETYRDVLIRLYSLVIRMSEKVNKLGKNTELVIVTHGQPAQVFNALKKLAKLIQSDIVMYKEGELAKQCWDLYKKLDASERTTGVMDVMSVEEFADTDLAGLLRKELSYLKNTYHGE